MKLILLPLLSLLFACGASQQPRTKTWSEGIYNLRTGELVSRQELQRVVSAAQFVIVGESHGSTEDHAIQAEVVGWSAAGTIVGMEMFQRPFQRHLDAFVAGKTDEQEMLEQTEWETRWGYDPSFYRPIWTLAKSKQLRLVALNLRRELTKRISGVGLDAMSDAEKSELPEYDLSDGEYRRHLQQIFLAHGEMSEEKLTRFYHAQVMWDETMADSAVAARRNAPDSRVILLVGRGHAERDWGIPSRIRRRTGAAYPNVVTIIPSRGELPDLETLRRQKFADFVWVTRSDDR